VSEFKARRAVRVDSLSSGAATPNVTDVTMVN
jgi:hypothetical protein